MKKLALALALSTIFMAGAASAVEQDNAHGMTIYGRLETAKSGCTVLMSKYVINLSHDDKYLPNQGDKLGNVQADDHIFVQLGGENCDANENYSKIGLKFLGTADNILGTSLANTDTASDAATGIGVQLSNIKSELMVPNVTVANFPGSTVINNSTDKTASFPLYFTLVKLQGQEATPGNVQTNLTVQIERL